MFDNLRQICFVTSDMDKTLASLEEVFGFVSPVASKVEPFHGVKYYGEDLGTCAEFRFFYFGDIELEIIMPCGGKSVWQDFLDKRGGGLHHMIFDIENFDAVEAHMTGLGYKNGQSGDCLRPSFKGARWAYYDTYEALGFYTEVYNLKEKGVSPPKNSEDPSKKLVSKNESLFYKLNRLGFISPDVEKTEKLIEQIFGWKISDKSAILSNSEDKYQGKEALFEAQKLSYLVNGIKLDFICPTSGKSVWQDYKDEKLQGIHHLHFDVDNFDEAKDMLKKNHVKEVQCGECGKFNKARWAYFDACDKFGFYVKIINPDENK